MFVKGFLSRGKSLLMAAVTICSDLEPKNMEKISFHSSPKERQCQRMLKLTHNCAHLTYYNVMFKILQARLQQYVNHELPDVQAGFRKCRGTRDQIANIHWIIEKAKEFQKNIYFCFINYARAFDCVDHKKLWTILRDRNTWTTLPAFWEICVQFKKQQLKLDTGLWTGSKLEKEYVQAVYCHPACSTYMQSTSCEMLG